MTSNRSLLLSSVIVSGLLLTVGLMAASFNYLIGAQQQTFDIQITHLTNMTRARIEDVKAEIRALATVFYAKDHIEPNTLQVSSEYTFAQQPAITKVIYAPIVSNANRLAFEATQHDEGFISFAISDYKNGSVKAAQRPTYLPISQVEPFNVDNASLLGIDLAHSKPFNADIRAAIKTGNDVAIIASLGGEAERLWLFKAIYSGFSGSSDPYFTKHSTEMVNGLVGLAVDVKQFIDMSAVSSPIIVHLSLQTIHSPSTSRQIFHSNAHHPAPLASGLSWTGINFNKSFTFKLEHQNLSLQASYHIAWFDRVFYLFFLSGLLGLGLTGLLSYSTHALLKSERRNAAILSSAMDAIISIDEHSIVQEFNSAAEKIFYYSSSEAIGRNIIDLLIPKAQRKAYKAGMAHYLSTGKQQVLGKQLEQIAIRSDGDVFPVELTIIEVISGKHRLFTAFLRDISSRKKAQKDLAQLATVVEQSFNAIIITDTKGIIQYVNPAFETLSGYSAKEAIGQRPSIVKSGEHSDQYYAAMWQALNNGSTWTGSFINQAKDGHMYHVEQTIFPLHVSEELVGYTSVQQDVTERDRLQEQTDHTQRLESLGVLAGGIAHDFNNLLTAIMGNTGLAQNKLPDQSPALKNLQNIQKASESAATLCQQMLAYSGKGHFIIEPLNLSATINDIMQLLESSITKQIELDIQLDHQLAAIDADVGQIKQIIMNLVINASEAIADHVGCIQIQTAHVNLNADEIINLLGADQMQAGYFIRLTVIDNGCGMDKTTRTKIFDPFFTTKFMGRGLGMSAILGIVRGHMGGLKISSKLGKGTRFDVYFPVSTHQLNQQHNGRVHEHDHTPISGTVLIVDDEEMLRDIAKSILENLGLSVILAGDGLKALEVLQQHHKAEQHDIDLVVLDMTMPKMGGEACYKKLRSFAPDLPVIICSGYAETEVRARFESSDNIDFIQKPYLAKTLQQKVTATFSRLAAG